MSDSLVNAVLANILARELVATGYARSKRHREVHIVDVLFGVITEVFHESVEVVTLWQIHTTVLVVL